MYYRTLGFSGLRVSAIGLGCMGMSHAYGAPADKDEMTELLADAVEMGYLFSIRPRCTGLSIDRTIMRNCWERLCNDFVTVSSLLPNSAYRSTAPKRAARMR